MYTFFLFFLFFSICISSNDDSISWNLPYLSQSPDAPRKIKLFKIFDSFVVPKRCHLKDQILVSVSSITLGKKNTYCSNIIIGTTACTCIFCYKTRHQKKQGPSLYQYNSRVNLCVLLTKGVHPLIYPTHFIHWENILGKR